MPFRPVSAEHACDVLGLARGALPADIKRAYRRLAMHWHPDRNGAAEAVDRFRQIRAAYDYLLGEETDEAGDDSAPADGSSTRGPDQRETLHLTIEEAIFGCEHEFAVGQVQMCEDCAGEGVIALERSRMCGDCHGSGRIRTATGLARCGVCDARGYVSRVTCESCAGSGQVRAARRVRVKVPPLMWPGRSLRLAGQATPEGDLPPGDLLLVAQINPHALFAIDGNTLRLRRPVSGFTLMAGGDVRVPVPGGESVLHLAPGFAEPDEQILAGQGLPCRDGERGDLHVQLMPAWPEGLNDDDIDALRQLQAHFDADAARTLPALAQWQARWLGEKAPPKKATRKKRARAAEGKRESARG